MLQITEDTPPDMLAGAMDLTVHLPDGKSTKMSVERSTPMMDLLVQITTNNQLQLSGYTLQALSMAPSSDHHHDRILPFKPNTFIGALDTQHIKVVPKAKPMQVPKNVPPGHQPFESTFRLKVHLPRNQLYVTRVSQTVHLNDIMRKVCEEKNLDPIKYEFRHPGNLDETLDPKLTLSDYKITEIYLVSKGTASLNQAFSTSDIMALRKEEERKQMHNKTGGGVFNLIFRRTKPSTGSVSSENRSISPTQSDDSRSVTPPAIPPAIITPPQHEERPKPPQRKRRPAPKPPQDVVKSESPTNEASKNGLTICHSRNSSDSSGYHEASILSDNLNTSLPRRPKSTILNDDQSGSSSNLAKMSLHSKSTSSLAFPNRKKKTAPPPPPVSTFQEPSPVVASQPSIVAQESDSNITPLTPMDSLRSFPSVESKEEAIKANAIENLQTWSSPEPAVEPQKTVELQNGAKLQKTAVLQSAAELDKAEEPQKIEELHEAAEPKQTVEPPKAVELHRPAEPQEETKANVEVESDWHYQLPSPPKAFRDSSPEPGEIDTTIPTDSVVTSPELFEKLKEVSVSEVEKQSDISEEEKPSILNTLSLENLEKRKSLVYNRELATSLKLAEEEDTFHSSVKKFERTYEEVRRSSLKETPAPAPVKSTLPNFKITTYDNPKQKINIFEDDTIRSSETGTKRNAPSNLLRSYVGRSMENINFNDFKKPYKPQVLPAKTFTSVSRSESFSDQGWSPSKPVTRSKSQLTINKYQDNKSVTQLNGDNLTKSNSLYDVSGLQSLEVMRLIQNKLNTPTSSVEELDGKKFENIPEKLPEAKKIEKKTSSYQYRTPSINMGTWSERPKIPVNVKEDPDYKHSSNSTKLIVNTTSNNLRSYNSIEVINKSEPVTFNHRAEKNVSVQVNNSEPISGQNTGNVVIKIGGYRKPLGNVNKNERPHSMTFGNEFDISRVPIVRSVELKKPYKEINTSVTQIYQNNESSPVLRPQIYQNHESSPVLRPQFGPKPFQKANTLNRISYGGEAEQKPIFRANSFVQNASPVVRGFRINTDHTKSWQQPQKDFGSNKSVPFSQSQLKRTESKKNELNQQPPPPPPAPPVLAKSFTVGGNKDNRNSCSADPKEQLLQAIRDFGGKKGLRAVKV